MDEEWLRRKIEQEREAREMRRKSADWNFIKSLPPKLRIALEYYVDSGDFRGASRIADMSVDEFLYFAKEKANIVDMS
ncbi:MULTISPECIES: hypothetical protein [Metallosphaera]|uniref:PaREP6 domain containing protein n=3 Tax=Metallosphaera TaxID=41980 RepID=A4YFQ2_METS5|nr:MULTISPECIES: hypothetical protein [Metallosphaera]ABP95254.1 PaREP6 domain containing protein [Metallosphaera sedula DSM 5348]AIM27240.1 PaREP6 domain containing protein [Metallosphaera sedula]AKV74129.1 hypothetical protein MsedA_1103 [Metallosphaera sedula]AKV76369.1 hypothetical protein MsedB_1105 [Metallosphaera sedula]AKV78620.1 hypothetical protein MsedC_1103 [Metallosphaera sedula]